MTLPRLRISARYLMNLVAIVAVVVAGGRHLIMDGSVTVELFNGLSRPLRDIRLVCTWESVVVNELATGGLIRKRLWSAEIQPSWSLNAQSWISFCLD
jgi:hypothetical protein